MNALLANLRISTWTGRRLDKQATNTVETAHATTREAGNYTKKLLPGSRELAEVQRAGSALRQFFYDQTLPWFADGTRILAATNYMDFTKAYRQKKAEYDFAAQEFLKVYPVQRNAQAKLGSLYNEGEYPTQKALEKAFSCDIAFMPMPDVGDFRVAISDEERKEFQKRMAEVQTNAMRECWTRLHDVVSKAAARLSDPNAVFRNSLVENIQEMCTLLPKLNVTDDPALEAARQNVETLVARIDVEACRDSSTERETAARALSSAMDKMSAFMGGSR